MDGGERSLGWIRDYYGRILRGIRDLKSNACKCAEPIAESHRAILEKIDGEILDRSYGCGAPVPPALEGLTVLDLGCGAGRDAYLASCLVGPAGRVIGVDMTDELLDVARRHQSDQAARFGLERSNVEFRKGYIEDLAAIGVADDSIDVVVSNCVINLSPRKEDVFAEIFRVLKPGGELHFSDVFAGRRVPRALREDPVLLGECLGGAMYVEDFRRLLQGLGCPDYRTVSRSRIALGNFEIERKVGMIDFYSTKVRAFKLAGLEDLCEDYGQVASYLGTVPDHPHRFSLDDHHTFEKGRPELVCGNTAAMLSETRFAKHFRVVGDRSVHLGPFDCGGTTRGEAASGRGGACCCLPRAVSARPIDSGR